MIPENLEQWVVLQDRMRSLWKDDNFQIFLQILQHRQGEVVEELIITDPKHHDRLAGYIEGLRWVQGYPQDLVLQVERLRQLPA